MDSHRASEPARAYNETNHFFARSNARAASPPAPAYSEGSLPTRARPQCCCRSRNKIAPFSPSKISSSTSSSSSPVCKLKRTEKFNNLFKVVLYWFISTICHCYQQRWQCYQSKLASRVRSNPPKRGADAAIRSSEALIGARRKAPDFMCHCSLELTFRFLNVTLQSFIPHLVHHY